jgi:hypothetical protein
MHLCMLFVFVERHQPTDKTEPILISLLPRSWEWTPSDLTPNSKGAVTCELDLPLPLGLRLGNQGARDPTATSSPP